jgi:hypothetical protein
MNVERIPVPQAKSRIILFFPPIKRTISFFQAESL